MYSYTALHLKNDGLFQVQVKVQEEQSQKTRVTEVKNRTAVINHFSPTQI